MFLSQPAFRSFVTARKVSVVASLALLGAIAPSASAYKAPASATAAARKHPRLHAIAHAFANVTLPGNGFILGDDDEVPTEGTKYEIKFVRAHTDEAINVVYRIGDTYIPAALEKLNHFLADTHNQQISAYDPRTFDVVHTMLAKIGKPGNVVDILSAYRSKETNDALRASGTTNAAEHSQHIEAKAIDLRVEGVPAKQLRDAALSLEAGGVGYYPKGQFIHVDTGPVRKWTYTHHAGRKRSHSRRAKRS